MKLIIILSLSFLLAGCAYLKEDIREDHAKNRKIVYLDSHAYYESAAGFGSGATYSLTHSGSCKNSSHVCQK